MGKQKKKAAPSGEVALRGLEEEEGEVCVDVWSGQGGLYSTDEENTF